MGFTGVRASSCGSVLRWSGPVKHTGPDRLLRHRCCSSVDNDGIGRGYISSVRSLPLQLRPRAQGQMPRQRWEPRGGGGRSNPERHSTGSQVLVSVEFLNRLERRGRAVPLEIGIAGVDPGDGDFALSVGVRPFDGSDHGHWSHAVPAFVT